MKRLELRFERYTLGMLIYLFGAGVFGFGAGVIIADGKIAMGVFMAVFAVAAFLGFLYFISRKEVVIDFKHNCIKFKTENKKRTCKLDKVEKLEILFQRVESFKCYSARVTAYFKNGKKTAIQIYPERWWSRIGWGYSCTGHVYTRNKTRIERQVAGYDFITCLTVS